VSKDAHAQVKHDALSRHLHRVGLNEFQPERRDEDDQKQQRKPGHTRQIAAGDVFVDCDLQQIGLRKLQRRGANDGGQCHRDLHGVRSQVAHQAPHQPRVVGFAENFFFVKAHRMNSVFCILSSVFCLLRCRQLLLEQLLLVKLRVQAVPFDEILMSTALDQTALIQHEDLIGIPNG
jgi:hypothetical protein